MIRATRFAAASGCWCLGQAAISALAQSQYALHELAMGLGALSAAALVCAVAAVWRFVHPVAA